MITKIKGELYRLGAQMNTMDRTRLTDILNKLDEIESENVIIPVKWIEQNISVGLTPEKFLIQDQPMRVATARLLVSTQVQYPVNDPKGFVTAEKQSREGLMMYLKNIYREVE